MKDFFISYNSADLEWAEWIARCLEDVGYTIILRSWNSSKVGDYLKELNYNSNYARGIIILLSADYFDMITSIDEWISTLINLAENKDNNLMTIKVRECSLYALLPQSVFL